MLVLLNLFFTEMVRVAEDYGGTVEKNTGDGLMAYFEETGEHTEENGSKRAVGAAMAMMEVNERVLVSLLNEAGLEPFRFSIGVLCSAVSAIARPGAAKRFNSLVAIETYFHMLACMMLAHAEPGEVILGESVVRVLPSDWQRYCERKVVQSGWVYRATSQPYPFYRYTGRWTA